METGLIIVKDDVFTKIRRNLFAVFFKKENKLLNMLYDLEKPRNIVSEKIIIPKEMKKFGQL